ncbi:RNA polymerase factor sigma-32 [Halobacteriovorax sp. GFR7]|uniref:RNA polymerase factor sigma-32 n=1 Tax=unclassified Halobacteriovorax TaxID=2639665 RepID=UPI003D95FF67
MAKVNDNNNSKDKPKYDVEVLPSVEESGLIESPHTISDEEGDYVDIGPKKLTIDEEVQLIQETLPALASNLPVPSKLDNKLNQYLKEISRYELLSPEQEKLLVKQFRESGDIDLAKKLVVSNLRLVVKIAMEYRSAHANVMDLIQEGNIGLMKAVSLFEPDKGAKLSYYASWWIKSYILKFILDNFKLVKLGSTNEQKKLFYNLMREKERLEAQGIKPDHKTIAQNLDVSEKAVALMDMRLGEGGSEVSIDTPVGESSSTMGDLLPDSGDFAEDIEFQQSLKLLQDNLDQFIQGLKPRDQEIFRERLLNDAPRSLQSIADDYGVSRERIRQIEARLLENLKVYMSEIIR